MANGNGNGSGKSNIMVAVERRRRIYDFTVRYGTVNVQELADELDVAATTIRQDLNAMHDQGKIVRVHGGAMIKGSAVVRPSYMDIRGENTEQKSWIGAAALKYLPGSGSIFLGGGSTAHQLATRLPEDRRLHVITNAPDVAVAIMTANPAAEVDLLGGKVRAESFETDCSASADVLDSTYWDVTFLGVSGIDVEKGITTVSRTAADYYRKLVEHAGKVVVLVDATKIGHFSYVRVCPVSLVDVIITDNRASAQQVEAIRAEGVEVMVVGPDGETDQIRPVEPSRELQ